MGKFINYITKGSISQPIRSKHVSVEKSGKNYPDLSKIRWRLCCQVVQILHIINSRVSLEVKRSLKKIGLHQADYFCREMLSCKIGDYVFVIWCWTSLKYGLVDVFHSFRETPLPTIRVGGWTNPFEKYHIIKLDHLLGQKYKIFETTKWAGLPVTKCSYYPLQMAENK